MEPELAVLVLNFNGASHLAACLEALEGQSVQGGFEVVVIDNASTDGSVELVRSRFPAARLVANSSNLGFAGGCNAGIRATKHPYVVLLNNDTRVRPGFLAALRAAALSDERAGAVTSKLVYADRPNVIQNAGTLLHDDGAGTDRGEGERDGGQYGLREEVFAFCGAAALLRREALDDCGLFDERFYMYYEDTDLSWRMRLRGWRIVYEPAAVVEHVHASTSGEWSDFFTFHVDRNRVLMLIKNAPSAMVARALRGARRRAASRAGHPVRAGIHGRVLRSLLRNLPYITGQRLRTRLRRRVPDADWERLLSPR
ncbi:MAG TPA: glycosyltransferase family 2 protein [Candidatus Dormibacteraeota bacterium]